MLETSVSNVEMYRIWKAEEDLDVGWILNKLLVREQTDKMKAGEAFHKALEDSEETEADSVAAMGYTFAFVCDADIVLPKMRECSVSKEYGGLLVKGRVDGIDGKIVTDLKTTEQVDLDRCMESLQWRFYLDMTEGDRFDWHIFQMRELQVTGPGHYYEVFGHHKLTQYRYVGLEEDCQKWADEYREFADRFIPK